MLKFQPGFKRAEPAEHPTYRAAGAGAASHSQPSAGGVAAGTKPLIYSSNQGFKTLAQRHPLQVAAHTAAGGAQQN